MNHSESFVQIPSLTKREARITHFLRHIKALGKAGSGIQRDNFLAWAHDFANEPAAQIERVEDNVAAERPTAGTLLGSRKEQAQFFLCVRRALEISGKIAETYWLLVQTESEEPPLPFVVVLVLWLTLLFTSFGLLAHLMRPSHARW